MNCKRISEELLKLDSLNDEVVFPSRDGNELVAVTGVVPTGCHRKAVTLELSHNRQPVTTKARIAECLLKTPDMELIVADHSGGWVEVLGVSAIGGPRWNPASFVLVADMGGVSGVIEYHEEAE